MSREAYQRTREGFHRGIGRTVEVRKSALRRLLHAVQEREEAILEALDADLGKPRLEAWLAEYHFVREDIRHALRHLDAWLRPTKVRSPFFVQPARSHIQREPHGTVLILSPWNYPFQLAISPLIAAIAGGNTAVVKPSEHAPATASLIAEILSDCFDPLHVGTVLGNADVAASLLTEPFDFYFFTGGEAVGRKVAQAAARDLKPCVLELGGKCPVIVDPSVEMETVVDRIVSAKAFNAGQTCFAPDFLLVPEREKPSWVHELRSEFSRRYRPAEDLARIVNRHHFDRILGLCAGETGVDRDDVDRLILSPRVIDADWSHPSMQEEVFGPVLPVIGYGPELLERLEKLPAPLALYLFSRDESMIRAVMNALPSGGVTINDIGKHAMNHHLPFGGKGASGYGRYRGRHGFDAFTYERSVTRRRFLPDPFALRAPYGNRLTWLKRLIP